MKQELTYAQLLRPIGQALEPMGIESFRVRIDGERIVVVGQVPERKSNSFRSVWRKLRGQSSLVGRTVELQFSPSDISRMEHEARTKRNAAGQTPDAHSLSQILRAAGAWVDQQGGTFLSISRQGQNLVLEYESALKEKISHDLTIAHLYDFWVRMYKRRVGR